MPDLTDMIIVGVIRVVDEPVKYKGDPAYHKAGPTVTTPSLQTGFLGIPGDLVVLVREKDLHKQKQSVMGGPLDE